MPLTETQREQLAALIAKRRVVLQAEIREDVSRSRADNVTAVGGEVRDAGDESVADLVTDTENAETARDIAELRALNAASARLQAGSYGQCQQCGIDIPIECLLANPVAFRCFPCQTHYEHTHFHAGELRL